MSEPPTPRSDAAPAAAAAGRQPSAAQPMQPLRLLAWTASTAAGPGRGPLRQALLEGRSALRPQDLCPGLPGHVGRIDALESLGLPPGLARFDCRNNRLAWLALQPDGLLDAVRDAVRRHGAGRVAVLMGTSTSSIGASEEAYAALTADGRFPPALRRPEVHTPHSLGAFVAAATGAGGPCLTVATACSSSAKVFAQAERLLRLGLADAALVGGVDSLCRSVLHGFAALGLVSPAPCRPFAAGRQGVSLAEAGGFALLERAADAPDDDPALRLLGHGESSDAHHMSAPHPQGLGARLAIQEALGRAGLPAGAIDYLNLHGTATPQNDAVEAAAVADLFDAPTLASSTKALTGHALGAAGIVEAVITCLALTDGLVPGNACGAAGTAGALVAATSAAGPADGAPDPALGTRFAALLAERPQRRALRVAMSMSFGFGGNNCALVFGHGPGR